MVAVTQLISQVEHAVGGPVSDQLGGSIAIVNAAGRHLFSCRQWNVATRATAAVDTVSGTNYCLLSSASDFGEVIDVQVTNSTTTMVRVVTMAEILRWRTSQLTGTGFGYRVAFSWRTISSLQVPVMEIWPTPTASSTGTFTLMYRAKWVDVTDDNTILVLPQFMEPVLTQFCRAFARGLEDHEGGSLETRLAEVEKGAVFAAATSQDGAMQTNFGPMRGSALDWNSQSICDPLTDSCTVIL